MISCPLEEEAVEDGARGVLNSGLGVVGVSMNCCDDLHMHHHVIDRFL